MAASSTAFEAPFVIQPVSQHTHTTVLLHGRGSTGPEFAEELIGSTLSNSESLLQELSSWKWVFPNSRNMWSTAFQEEMPAWFEAHSLTDTSARQDLQMNGIRECLGYLRGVLEAEIQELGGVSRNLVFGGISQGAAVGLWALLCQGEHAKKLGCFVGASTWLPFVDEIARLQEGQAAESDSDKFVEGMMDPLAKFGSCFTSAKSTHYLPIFLGHGTDDAYVDVELGRRARDVLSQLGFSISWKEYEGAEQEGHWLKVPEEMDDIRDFLMKSIKRDKAP